MKKTLLFLLASVCVLTAQTPNTNDIKATWNVPCQYSTNQWTALVWQYRNLTNSIPLVTNVVQGVSTNVTTSTPVPSITDWHIANVRRMSGQMADSYVEQRKAAETSVSGWISLRDAWADLTPAQRTAVLNAAGLNP
jgi:hypothetical protein